MPELVLRSAAPVRPSSMSMPERFVSYAQNGEDVMLYRALRAVERGCYVDVGAFEPVAGSVTCAFCERGWRGVNLEPAPGAFERLSAARPEDINLNVAAGDLTGMADFFLVDGGNRLTIGLVIAAPKLET